MGFFRRHSGLLGCALTAAALAIVVSGCSRGQRETQPHRVFVFGIDGGTWDVLEPMMEGGELPNIGRLYASGIHGVLRSRPPVISPVVWTTIFSGRPHAEHGLTSWKTSQSKHRKVKTVWEIVSTQGRVTDVFNVPGTWPPTPLGGVMISGFPLGGATIGGNTGVVVSREGLITEKIHPIYAANRNVLYQAMNRLAVDQWSEWVRLRLRNRPKWRVATRIKRLAEDRYYLSPCYRDDAVFDLTYPPGVRTQLGRVLGDSPYIPEGPGWSRYAEPDTPRYLAEHLTAVARVQTRAVKLFAAQPWDLLIYVSTLVDRVSHPYWAYMHPEDYVGVAPGKVRLYRGVVGEAYRETDRQLGELLSVVDGDYYVVIVSDHGFRSSPQPKRHIGAHDYAGIYLVSGPGLSERKGGLAYIEDIAPTVLYLLGLPVGADMSGRVVREISAGVGRDIEMLPSYEDGREMGSDVPVDAQTWEQLRGLGYVDGAPPRAGRH